MLYSLLLKQDFLITCVYWKTRLMHQPLSFSWNLANNSEQVQKTGAIWGHLSNSIKQTRNVAKVQPCQNPKVHTKVIKSSLTSRTNERQIEALIGTQVAILIWFVGTYSPSVIIETLLQAVALSCFTPFTLKVSFAFKKLQHLDSQISDIVLFDTFEI